MSSVQGKVWRPLTGRTCSATLPIGSEVSMTVASPLLQLFVDAAPQQTGKSCPVAASVTAGHRRDSMADNDPKTPQDLSDFAENLLKKLQERFQSMSDQLTERMEEMGSNIDKLQNDVSDLMTQAGIDNTDEVVH
ncbi:heat shock factor-binding protein 1-like protein 1 isoform X1 [Dendrobates tinctorius]|uniref:heat shock factor-binding protein 1-like protein 1 isoform X1 n=2 Tax=Dendrobates tinctorius TaxID=92724 RepID=UPI003CC94AA6